MLSDADRMAAIANAYATTSDKIRALDAAGYSRADIARFLGKLYQHVRNVLVAGPPKGSPFAPAEPAATGFEETPAEPYTVDAGIAILRLPLSDGGAVQLPPMALAALGLQPGGVAIAELHGDHLVLFSTQESIRRVQAMVRDLIPGRHSLADSLIADRRQEVEDDG
jgi:hypothetical protein